jgi:chromosomal replication initiation ATPase DnaA
MQTIRDLIEETIKESITYLIKKKGMTHLKSDPFVSESILTKVLSNTEIRKIKGKMLPIVKDSSSMKNNRVPIEKPIILGTHSIMDIQICQIGAKLFDVQYNKLFVACREREVVDCRMQTANIMHKYLGYSTTKIGSIFSKDHSTIVHWLSNHSDLIESSNSYLHLYQEYLNRLKEAVPGVFYNMTARNNISLQFKQIEESTRILAKKANKLKLKSV